jgi:hypothetical protein
MHNPAVRDIPPDLKNWFSFLFAAGAWPMLRVGVLDEKNGRRLPPMRLLS